MKQISRPTAVDLILLLFIAVIWGSAFTSMKIAVIDMGAMWTAASRVCIGFLCVLPFLCLQFKLPPSLKVWGMIIVVAMLNMVVPFILISWAMKHVDAGVGALLLGTTPFIAMVIGHFATQDEHITPMKLLAVVCAVSGIAVLVGVDAISGLGNTTLLAQLAIIISGGCYVCAGFIMRRIDMSPIAFTTFGLGTGSILLVTLSFLFAGTPNTSPTTEAVYALLWLGALPTGFAYVMRFYLVKRVGVSTFALAMNTVPIFGIIIGAVMLGELVEWTTLVALGLVLLGLVIARYEKGAIRG